MRSVVGTSGKTGAHVSMPVIESCPAFRLPDAQEHNAICRRCYARRLDQARPAAQPFYRKCFDLWVARPHEYWRRFHYEVGRHDRLRLFMSGDMPSEAYAHQLFLACRNLPQVKFWLSSKTVYIPAFHEALAQLCSLRNVVVRCCAMTINADIRDAVRRTLPSIPGMRHSAVVRREDLDDWRDRGHICPAIRAPKGQRSCEAQDCFACWDRDRDVEMVVYPLH